MLLTQILLCGLPVVPTFLVNADGSLGALNKRALGRHRAQAWNPRRADLHDDRRPQRSKLLGR
jgi:hypothetical protein